MTELHVRAIRGATTVERDEAGLIRTATRELLEEMVRRNGVTNGALISILFTVTADLRAEFPARAARDLAWDDVPLLCTVEIPVPGALPRCVRVLMHVESSLPRDRIRHVYLGAARALRPDL